MEVRGVGNLILIIKIYNKINENIYTQFITFFSNLTLRARYIFDKKFTRERSERHTAKNSNFL